MICPRATITKAHIQQSKEMYYNTKKLKPGLVASYDSGLEMERAYSGFSAS